MSQSHLILQFSLIFRYICSSIFIKKFENILKCYIAAGANFLKLVPLLVVHGDVDLELAELRKLKAFFDDVFGSLAFGVAHFDWIGNRVQDVDDVVP
jgi:hypothetical protein